MSFRVYLIDGEFKELVTVTKPAPICEDEGELLSDCCGMPSLGEVVSKTGICSGCHDHACFVFESDD